MTFTGANHEWQPQVFKPMPLDSSFQVDHDGMFAKNLFKTMKEKRREEVLKCKTDFQNYMKLMHLFIKYEHPDSISMIRATF